MKHLSPAIVGAVLAGFALVPLHAADGPKLTEATTYEDKTAVEFVRQHPDSRDELEACLKKLGCPKGALHDAIVRRVIAMQKAVADGTTLKSEAFWGYYRQLAELTDDKPAGAPPPAADGTPKPAKLTTADLVSYAKVLQQLQPAAAAGAPASPDLAKLLAETTSPASAPPAAGGGVKAGEENTDGKNGDGKKDDGPLPDTKAGMRKFLGEALAEAKKAEETVDDLHLFFHGGLRTLAPYTIDKATGRLISGSPRSNAFVEFVYSDVWAWRAQRVDQTRAETLCDLERKKEHPDYPVTGRQWFLGTAKDGTSVGFADNSADFIARLGYNFGQDQEPSATTIAGSGAFSAQLLLDQHLYRGWRDGSAYSLSLGLSYSGVSDADAMKIHSYWLLGPSISVGFTDPVGDSGRRGFFRAHFGIARTDEIVLSPDFTTVPATDTTPAATYRKVEFDGDRPKFRHTRPAGLQMLLCYPFAKQSLVTLSGSFYGPMETDEWNLQIGLTVPITTIAESLAK